MLKERKIETKIYKNNKTFKKGRLPRVSLDRPSAEVCHAFGSNNTLISQKQTNHTMV